MYTMTIEVENAENVSNPGGNFAFTCTTCTVKAAYSSTDWKKKFRINNTRLNGKTQTTISVPEGYIFTTFTEKIKQKDLKSSFKREKVILLPFFIKLFFIFFFNLFIT